MAGNSDRKTFRDLCVACAVVFLCAIVFAVPAFSVKVKDSGNSSEPSPSTLITIETLEQISSRSATSTLTVETATATVPIETATSTATVETATQAVVAEPVAETAPAASVSEKPAAPEPAPLVETKEPTVVETAPETPVVEAAPAVAPVEEESKDQAPEAYRSQRYKDKLKEVSEEGIKIEESGKTAQAEEKPVAPEIAEKPAPVETKDTEAAAVETAKTATPEPAKAEPEKPKDEKPAPVVEAPEETKQPEPTPVAEKTAEEQKQPTAAAPEKKEPTAPEPEKQETAKVGEDAPPAPVAAQTPAASTPKEEKKPESAKTVKAPEPAPKAPAATTPQEQKQLVAEKPAQPKETQKPAQAEKSAKPAAQPGSEKTSAPKAGLFTVRSAPITDENEKDEMVRRLTLENYHPVVKEIPVKEGRKYYVLEMGAFKDSAVAAGLLYQLRNVPGEFFIVNPDGENVDAGEGLVPLDKAGRLIPHRSGELGDNSLALISDYARREGRAPAAMDAPVATGPRKLQRRLNAPKYIRDDEEKPVEKRVDGVTLSNKLRDIAWEMREGGYGVYLEQETFLEEEGVLVGVMEDKDEASRLGQELLSYGYAVNIIFKGDGNYYVYADVDNPAREITVVDKELLLKHGVTNDFAPPPDPMADNLLRLIPKKNR